MAGEADRVINAHNSMKAHVGEAHVDFSFSDLTFHNYLLPFRLYLLFQHKLFTF